MRLFGRDRSRKDAPRRRGLRALVGESRGSAIIEFAFVAAPFVALLIAVLETALVFFVQEELETAVEVAARSVLTGKAQSSDASASAGGMSQSQLAARFKQTACASLPSFLNCANLYVDVQSAPSFSAINTSNPTISYDQSGAVANQFSYNLGGQGAIVMVRLIYMWPVPTSPLGLSFSNLGNNSRMILATSVAKTEDYS